MPEFQRRLGEAAGRGRLPVPADAWAFRSAFLEFLPAEFGRTVFDLVMAVTEAKNDGKPPRDWLERKKEQLGRLTAATPDEAALKAADALHNIECTLRDLRRAGLGVLDRFRGGALVAWHYSAIAQLTSERMPAATRWPPPCATRPSSSRQRSASCGRRPTRRRSTRRRESTDPDAAQTWFLSISSLGCGSR